MSFNFCFFGLFGKKLDKKQIFLYDDRVRFNGFALGGLHFGKDVSSGSAGFRKPVHTEEAVKLLPDFVDSFVCSHLLDELPYHFRPGKQGDEKSRQLFRVSDCEKLRPVCG